MVSVDPPEVQLAQARTWHLPFRFVSDPDGERLAKPLGAWDPDAKIFRPLTVGVAPSGEVVFAELSRDFTDRPDDEPPLTALEALGLPARTSTRWEPEGVEPEPSARAFTPKSFITYFRAIRFNLTALLGRMSDDHDRAEVQQEKAMAESFLAAFDSWRTDHPQH